MLLMSVFSFGALSFLGRCVWFCVFTFFIFSPETTCCPDASSLTRLRSVKCLLFLPSKDLLRFAWALTAEPGEGLSSAPSMKGFIRGLLASWFNFISYFVDRGLDPECSCPSLFLGVMPLILMYFFEPAIDTHDSSCSWYFQYCSLIKPRNSGCDVFFFAWNLITCPSCAATGIDKFIISLD